MWVALSKKDKFGVRETIYCSDWIFFLLTTTQMWEREESTDLTHCTETYAILKKTMVEFTVHSVKNSKLSKNFKNIFNFFFFYCSLSQNRSTGSKPVNREWRVEFVTPPYPNPVIKLIKLPCHHDHLHKNCVRKYFKFKFKFQLEFK
jgi:hypothetical protein